MDLPPLPTSMEGFLPYLATQSDVTAALRPFKDYEGKLREIYAQDANSAIAKDRHVNTVPLFVGHESSLRVRARELDRESDEEKDSSYYHDKLAPASDVDLFMYGLDEEQAIEKIKQIETKIQNSILTEITTIRTKHAITIASQYPTRHVQIVLRLYKSVSEILTGFDVDCSCVAYDGHQVWAAPRAVAAFITQTNTIDLSRRSPSYENRLSKYSHRGFEVYWPLLNRSKIDPTIFERSFSRVKGLARLLVFEKLPGPDDRETYLAKRRAERGRPRILQNIPHHMSRPANVKELQPDDVAEWVEENEVSNYHTFAVPYGPRYNAKKIEKLLFTKDLLLNAEWNRAKGRNTNLHRHPAFFGSANDVIQDCCGFCPEPLTDEDRLTAGEESKTFISGSISFLKDDPGRQMIGSFHPITDHDWTEMAYVGNTARLCQAIVDGDLEHVEDWCAQEGVDVNCRDYTGRTPLHLAAMSSTPEILQCLIDHGARLGARLVDGFTALHIASRRGNVAMVKALLERGEANEEEEARKEDLITKARRCSREAEKVEQDSGFTDIEMEDVEKTDDNTEADDTMEDTDSTNSDRMTEGSFVKLSGPGQEMEISDKDNEDEPDVLEVNVLTWDYPVSPLHLAIMGGHIDVIEMLVSTFGADVLLPIKVVNPYDNTPKAAIFTFVLALRLPSVESLSIAEKLLILGASSSQADMNGFSVLQYVIEDGKIEILDMLLKFDEPAARRAVNHVNVIGWQYNAKASIALLAAIQRRHFTMAKKLLEVGAEHTISREAFVQAYHRTFSYASRDPEEMKKAYETTVEQPIIAAASCEMPELVQHLMFLGADVNTMSKIAYSIIHRSQNWPHTDVHTLLDLVQRKIKQFKKYEDAKRTTLDLPSPLKQDDVYLKGLQPGSYKHWLAVHDLAQAKSLHEMQMIWYKESLKEPEIHGGAAQKAMAVANMLVQYKSLEKALLAKRAETFAAMYPHIKLDDRTALEYQYGYGVQQSSLQYHVPYMTTHKFLVPDLTDAKIHGYSKLFDAAWAGDTLTVKELTLGAWGNHYSPLQIAITDLRGFSPFSIAVIRGHLGLAKVIIDIATVQYQPYTEKDEYRYALKLKDADYSDSDSDLGHDEIRLVSKLVDEKFTIDDVFALSGSIRSRISPMQLLTFDSEVWRAIDGTTSEDDAKDGFMPPSLNTNLHIHNASKTSWAYFHGLYEAESKRCRWSLFRYAIAKNDLALLRFLTDIGNALAKSKGDDENLQVFTCSHLDYDFAVRLGRLEMIGHLIATTGASIPLEKLVKVSGIAVQEKPTSYQGLSVHGKKKKDWADEARGTVRAKTEEGHPPLLSVAFEGNLDSIEYFMGDAPLRRYREFATVNRDDKRIKALVQAEGGIDTILSTWLNVRNSLAIHMSVMSKPTKDGSNPALDFLIRNMPEWIDAKSASGTTPLQLAFQLNRLYAARTLIAAGANQITRNRTGENLLHTILQANSSNPDLLRASLALLNQKLIPSMLLERCADLTFGSFTPLAQWIYRKIDEKTGPEVLQILLEYSKGEDLNILDGAGDYPLNYLIRTANSTLTETIINYKPALIYKENSVGMTPIDIADSRYLADHLDHPPFINHHSTITSVVDQDPINFLPKDNDQNATKERGAVRNWKLLHQAAALHPGKRQLVSLFDANEVAKRLAVQQREKTQREEIARKEKEMQMLGSGSAEESKDKGDEVQQWMPKAQSFEKWDLEAFEKEFVKTKSGDLQG